jgi:iron complex transport system substrate-binding protein
MRDLEELARIAIDCGFKIHNSLGPGLLESVYEVILADALAERGLYVQRQKPIPIHFNGRFFDEGFRADLLVDDRLLIELKSTERLLAVHGRQVLTYLKLLDLPLGILMNFGCATFKEGAKRIVNNHTA